MIANILIAIGALIVFLDFVLEEEERTKIDAVGVRLSKRLDGFQEHALRMWRQGYRIAPYEIPISLLLGIILAGFVIYGYYVILPEHQDHFFEVILVPTLMQVVTAFAPMMTLLLWNVNTYRQYLVRSAIAVVAIAFAWALQYYWLSTSDWAGPHIKRVGLIVTELAYTVVLVILLYTWIMSAAKIATAYFLMGVLWLVARVVRRLGKHPKGVVMGIGVLVGFGAALYKVFV